jgi:rare lipoprotein A
MSGEQVASAQPLVTTQDVISDDLPPPAAVGTVSNEDIEDLNKQLFRKFPVAPTNLFVQVGSFTNPGNANNLKGQLASLGNVNVYPTMIGGKQFYRVRIGPVGSVGQADSVLGRTIAKGYPTARIVVD